jgi:TrmH family RNA methyltransferase
MITSNQNPKIKLARNLAWHIKERQKNGAFLAEGARLVEEALISGWPFRFVLIGDNLNARGRNLVSKLQTENIIVEQVSDPLLNSVSSTQHTQGILAILNEQDYPVPSQLDFVLIPDQIRDPGNLGTLLRTAFATGVQAVLLPPETVDGFSPKVIRAGMGAHFHLPILKLSWSEIQNLVREMHIFLADMSAPISCWQANFKVPLAIIIGGEAEGASQEARTLASQEVFIPMMEKAESLNAGVAGAVLLYEVFRQRRNL